MAHTATLAIPFAKRGIATGTNLLQQFVGIGKAMEWALLAPALSAAEAERWGLVNRVVPLDRLEQETTAIARELAEGPSLVLGYTKSAIVHGWQTHRRKPHTVTRDRRSIIRNELRISRRASRHFAISAHPDFVGGKASGGPRRNDVYQRDGSGAYKGLPIIEGSPRRLPSQPSDSLLLV